MNPEEKSLLLAQLIEGFSLSDKKEKAEETPLYLKEPTEYVEKLRKRKASFLEEKHTFSVGDIVMWKDGLKNKRLPAYGEPCIVLKVHEEPIIDEDDVSDLEELDVKIGIISPDDDFLCFNYDSARLKKVNLK